MAKPAITKEKVLAYERVRESGRTNMFDVIAVSEIALEDGVLLTREDILDIMHNYDAYMKKHLART